MGDAVEPGREGVGGLQGGEATQDDEHGVVGRVFRVDLGPSESVAPADDDGQPAFEQPRQRYVVPRRRGLDELPILLPTVDHGGSVEHPPGGSRVAGTRTGRLFGSGCGSGWRAPVPADYSDPGADPGGGHPYRATRVFGEPCMKSQIPCRRPHRLVRA